MEETITGIQDSGTQACAKHFIGNEQESMRNPSGFLDDYQGPLQLAISANIDDRYVSMQCSWPQPDATENILILLELCMKCIYLHLRMQSGQALHL